MPQRPSTHSAVAGVTMVTAGSMIANIASYLLHLPASRWLGPVGYGEFASLLAAQLVLAVPALALQTVAAREVVHGRNVHAVRALGGRCTAIVAVVAIALVPVVSWALDTGLWATFAALITAPMLVLLATEQGILQGEGRFGELSVVLAGAGIGKVLPAVVVLALGGDAGFALVASAVGTAVVALTARALAGAELAGTGGTAAGPGSAGPSRIGVGAVLAASQVQLALIALSSMDLVIARMVLTNEDAGLYALGAVATKVAFWLPQAVGVVLYPRMANPVHSASAVRSALAVLVGLGGVLVVGVAVASPLVPMLVGADYAPVQSLLWAFALHGACLAVLQGALLSAIAGERTHLAAVAWVGLVVEMAVMVTVASTVGQMITIAVSVASVTALVVSVLSVRAARAPRPD
ncbi:MAG: polysaccharide biosynthesis protein [Rhodococcus sp.]|nr:polysaccharide biosynthesis protein [Rhodococcus sp. (in: high G+C Gram-positive bacteria)]